MKLIYVKKFNQIENKQKLRLILNTKEYFLKEELDFYFNNFPNKNLMENFIRQNFQRITFNLPQIKKDRIQSLIPFINFRQSPGDKIFSFEAFRAKKILF